MWPVSTPEEQGLDPDLVAEMYYNASQMENIYSLLVFKNGYLVAEDYYHIGRPDYQTNIHSVTKSITSALVGIAIEDGCISGVDAKMMDFFPELQDQITDPRKNDITIEQLLQHRAGYAWEESSTELLELLYQGFLPDQRALVVVPLVRDPGSGHDYSNLSSHLLAIIVSRACDADLLDFATDIAWLVSAGVTRGCNPPTDDRFCPDSSVTRGQMAAFLVRALDLPRVP